MADPRPAGHPGEDPGLKLALTRLLVQNGIATKAQVEAALAAEKATGALYVTLLVEAGLSSTKMLAMLARAAGLPAATGAWVRKPHAELAAAVDPQVCRSLLGVPFRRVGTELHVAFAAPLPKDVAAHFPPHVAHVALEADVRAGLDALYRGAPSPAADAPTEPVTAGSVPTGTVPGLPPLPDGGALPTLPALDGLPPLPDLGELPPLPGLGGLPPLPGPPPPGVKATDLAAAGQPPIPKPSRPRAQVPMGPHAEPELPGEVTVTNREILMSQLKRARWPAAGILGLILTVKGIGCFIDRTRTEVDKRGSELAAGMGLKPLGSMPTGALPPGARGEGFSGSGGAAPSAAAPSGSAGSDSVSDAVLRMDRAIKGKDMGDFIRACDGLTTAMSAATGSSSLGMVQRSDMRGLYAEAQSFCARERMDPSAPEWPELRTKVMRVLNGDNPRDGPRYQIDAPPEYTMAKADLDAAIRGGDVGAACSKLSRVRNAIADWMERMPGGFRVMRMNEVVNQDLENFLMNCSTRSLNDIREFWIRIQQKIEPGG